MLRWQFCSSQVLSVIGLLHHISPFRTLGQKQSGLGKNTPITPAMLPLKQVCKKAELRHPPLDQKPGCSRCGEGKKLDIVTLLAQSFHSSLRLVPSTLPGTATSLHHAYGYCPVHTEDLESSFVMLTAES